MRRLAAALLAAVLLAACSRAPRWHTEEGAAWGTLYHLTYNAPASLHDSVRAVMRAVELSVSRCEPWGFGPSGERVEPRQEQIDSALQLVGILDCRLEGLRFVRKHPGTRFDFSAIAKGMGVDAVAAMLRRNGVTDYMVEIGGEVALGGRNPRGDDWRIQIDAPVDDPDGATHERMRVVAPGSGSCIATSGNYRNYRTLRDGTRAAHIISPATGRTVAPDVLSATVVAPSCMLADALATAAMAMPSDSALAMVRRLPGVRLILAVAVADTFRIADTAPAHMCSK